MNTIHMRFIGKRNEIIGYGKIIQDTEIPFAVFVISDDGVKWEYRGASARSYHPPERGIEVRGSIGKDTEIWYHNDTFMVDDKRAVLEYRENIHEWVFRCTDIRDSYGFADAVDSGCEIIRIGNIHEGDRP